MILAILRDMKKPKESGWISNKQLIFNMKTFVMIPTFNEKENIEKLIEEILNLKIKDLYVVVVDDNSPDGTSEIVEKIVKENRNIGLLLRRRKKGRGYAGKDGFKYCLRRGADYVIEMDADFSHNPKYIPDMLEKIKKADVVIGSRLVEGGKDIGRGVIREIITKLANAYVRIMLNINVKDCNSGFRCFRRKVLEEIDLTKLRAKGPEIVQEILFKVHKKGFKIKEIPIIFRNRTRGKSKLSLLDLAKGYFMILRLRFL